MDAQKRPIMRTITVTNVHWEIYHNSEILMSHSSSWRWDNNGTVEVHTVTTTYRSAGFENETIAEFDARHAAKVAADRLLYPPIAD